MIVERKQINIFTHSAVLHCILCYCSSKTNLSTRVTAFRSILSVIGDQKRTFTHLIVLYSQKQTYPHISILFYRLCYRCSKTISTRVVIFRSILCVIRAQKQTFTHMTVLCSQKQMYPHTLLSSNLSFLLLKLKNKHTHTWYCLVF